MYSQNTFHQNAEDTKTFDKTDTITMTCLSFLQYWLYAAFPHCNFLQKYLLEHIPYPQEWVNQMFGADKGQEVEPIRRTAVIDQQEVIILMYRYHVEYRIEDKELLYPCFSYLAAEELDNDTFFLLLPVVDMTAARYMTEDGYSCLDINSDLLRRLSETPLPTEHVKEAAYGLDLGLEDGDGAEEVPLWYIWQETADTLYGAGWWQDAEEFVLFRQQGLNNESFCPSVWISAPEGEDAFQWGKRMLSQWISSLSVS